MHLLAKFQRKKTRLVLLQVLDFPDIRECTGNLVKAAWTRGAWQVLRWEGKAEGRTPR